MSNTINIPISKLELNNGQLDGLPKNPRFIRDENFERLKKSLQDSPEMLNLRELLVFPLNDIKYIVIGGNMRLRAAKELGFKELPCKVIPKDTPIKKLREYTIKDNNPFGENDWELLANEWDDLELDEFGLDLPTEWSEEPSDEELSDGKEIDVDDFADKVEIKFSFTQEEWQFLNSKLKDIDPSKETALLKIFNYQQENE